MSFKHQTLEGCYTYKSESICYNGLNKDIRSPLMLCPAKQFMTAKPSIHVLENGMVLGDNSRKNELKSVDFMN